MSSPVTDFGYDGNGNRTSVTDPLGRETFYAYDEVDRLISVTQPDPDGGGPLASPVTEYEYDAVGNLLTVIDPLNNETTFAYDALRRLTTVTQADAVRRRH